MWAYGPRGEDETPLPGFVVGLGHQDRRDAFHLRTKTDVEVPLVLDGERLHAAGDRVLGQRRDLGHPVRVGRVARFVIAADPVQELVAGLALGHLDGVVQAGDAHALVDQLLDDFEVVLPG